MTVGLPAFPRGVSGLIRDGDAALGGETPPEPADALADAFFSKLTKGPQP